MKHLGNITAIDGKRVPSVDVVIGGSPCQDLSMAGKRQGLSGERSGLFLEQIRIVKEMRRADAERGSRGRFIRPRYMVWENVVGAFSSNNGNDFRTAIEETAKIADPATVIPRPAKGEWDTNGCIVGDRWSIAYRVLDAQFWGVPQRRRRIALVADFGGESAPEILFVRKSVCGDIGPGEQEGKTLAPGIGNGLDPENRIDAAGFLPLAGAKAGSIGYQPEQAPTLTAGQKAAVLENYGSKSVRRLTELECERLQGFPDGWTDIGPWVDSKGRHHKESSASERYKALGNSIALPPWTWVLKRLCACYEYPATMASLFDGIGGFPLIWEQINGLGSCLWASEIDEFAIAVTNYHFNQNTSGRREYR